MNMTRTFLILGAGSMGKRRVRCLQAHGIPASQIKAFDQREDRRQECSKLYGVEAVSSFQQGWDWNPDVVIISLPSKLHITYCLEAARSGKDFWCEIALSDGLEHTDELLTLVDQRGLVAALGINNPFHFALKQAKEWLQDPQIGHPLTYHVAFGNYLPNWHPWEDYRDFYDETQIMGVVAQELGTLYTLLDTRLSEIYGQMFKLGNLDIPGPDNIRIVGQTLNGTAVSIQLDLLQDIQQYNYRIVCENGVIEVGFFPQMIARRYLNHTQRYEEVPSPKGYQFEQCYIDEFGLFLKTLEKRGDWYHPLQDAVQIIRCLEALKESNKTGSKITLTD